MNWRKNDSDDGLQAKILKCDQSACCDLAAVERSGGRWAWTIRNGTTGHVMAYGNTFSAERAMLNAEAKAVEVCKDARASLARVT